MDIFIVFICLIVLCIYFVAGQEDDISFAILIVLLSFVLYFVFKCQRTTRKPHLEFFVNDEVVSSTELSPTLMDQIKDTYSQVYNVFEENVDYVITSMSGETDEENTVTVTEEDFKGNNDDLTNFRKINAILFYIEKYDPDYFKKLSGT